MTAHQCSMCTRPTAGKTATGLCGYCVNHKCKPENAERIRAKRTAAYRASIENPLRQIPRTRGISEQLESRRAEVGLR